jgi:hypothetical protein
MTPNEGVYLLGGRFVIVDAYLLQWLKVSLRRRVQSHSNTGCSRSLYRVPRCPIQR